MSVTKCLMLHFGKGSPIAEYKAGMADDVDSLVKGGMTTRDAWVEVAKERVASLTAERTRIEQVVSDAYAKTAAGKREGFVAAADAAPAVATEATHKDPGEPAEAVTPAVVAEAIKTGVQATDRKPSEMKAELLAKIDAAIPAATHESRTQVPRSAAARDDPAHYVRFKVPGDGTFTVMNAKDALTEFRAAVEKSAGFRDRQATPTPPRSSVRVIEPPSPKNRYVAKTETVAFGDALNRRAPDSAVKAMIDDGDPQAAVDYAAARGLDIADVLKGDKVRLPKIAGLTPTTEDGPVGEFEPEAAAPAAPQEAEPAAAQEAKPSDGAQRSDGVSALFQKALQAGQRGPGALGEFMAVESFLGELRKMLEVPSDAGVRSKSSQLVEPDSATGKRDFDGVRGHAKALADILESNTGPNQRLGALDAETQRLVLSHVLALSQDSQVLKAVVQLVPVDVVNDLAARQLSPESLFNDPAMVKLAVAGKLGDSVALARYAADTLVRSIALAGAEVSSAGVFTELVGPAGDRGATSGAQNSDLRHGSNDTRNDGIAVPMPPVAGIPREAAQEAHRGTSHVPEQRAVQEQQGFMSTLQDAWQRAARVAGNDTAAIERITEVFTDVADGYRSRYMSALGARSRVMSTMITGAGNFPVARNQKRMDTERRRSDEAQQYLERGIKRLLRAARGPIDNSPESELERVRLNLSQREEAQEQMKAANAALRKGDDDALSDLGFTDAQIADLKKPDFAGRKGFPDYKLINNNAEIRRLRERLKDAEARMAAAKTGPVESERAGVKMVEDATDDRLRLMFDGKPSEAVRDDLKAEGFKWSPKNEAWQRQLTDNARAAARRVMNKHFPADDAGNVEMFSLADEAANPPPFYSELARMVEKVPMNAAPAAGWKMWLKGLPAKGVKPDEIEWTGIAEWLDLQPGKITKSQVAAYLDVNGVQVTETVLGAPQGQAEFVARLESLSIEELRDEAEDADVEDVQGMSRAQLVRAIVNSYEDGMPGEGDRSPGDTKFGQYTLPGGTNYREVLLTLPERRPLTNAWRSAQEQFGDEDPRTIEAKKQARAEAGPSKTYKSAHWDQSNVLAHVRLNDRTDAQGRRVLFVEELQADKGQEWTKLKRKIEAGTATAEDKARFEFLDALPFNPTDKWLTLALKRVVKMAVDEGYDAVAFVNGEQSAERYDLSKQISAINYEPFDGDNGKRLYEIEAIGLNDNKVFSEDEVTIERIEELVGKDIAKKIAAEEGKAVGMQTGYRNWHRLSGLDLKVGGEGMRAFYDQIVPAATKSLLKKLGGGQMETVSINNPDAKASVDKWVAWNHDIRGSKREFNTEREARDYIAQQGWGDSADVAPIGRGGFAQPGFTITPAMREKAAGGLPLFDARGLANTYTAPDTASYEPAGNADQAVTDELAERLNRGQPRARHVVLDAVTPRAGAATARARELAAVATTAKRLFGHRVVFVRFNGAKPLFNGVVSDTIPGVIFINADSKKPMMSVLGHELLHKMRKQSPALYSVLKQRLARVMKNQPAYMAKLESAYAAAGRQLPNDWMEELHADVVGDFFTDAQFWQDMAAEQPTLFKRVAGAILKFLDDVAAHLTSVRPFGTEQFLTDVKAARAAVAGAMREFSGAEVGAMTGQSEGINLSIASPEGIQRTLRENLPEKFVDWVQDGTTSQRGFNRWGHRTVSTQLHKAKINKEFGKVFYAVQDFMRDVSRIATHASDLAPDMLVTVDDLAGLSKIAPTLVSPKAMKKRKADLKAASDALFDGTSRYMRDEDGNAVPVPDDLRTEAGLVWSDAELKERGASPEAIAMYRQARESIGQSLDSLLAADIFKRLSTLDPEMVAENPTEHAALIASMRRAVSSETPGRAISSAMQAFEDAIARIDVSLEGQPNQYTDGLTQKRKLLSDVMADAQAMVSRVNALKQKGYAPLMRFGPYVVDILTPDGGRVGFRFYETQLAANRAAREMREQGYKVNQSIRSEQEYKMLDGLSPDVAMMFADMLGVDKSAAMQAYLQNALAEQSALKRRIRRKNVEGFNEDGQRVLAAFITSNARAASRGLHSTEIQNTVDSIQAGDVKDEAIALANYVNDPKEEAQAVRSLLFVNYIGGSIASALVNLTQTFVQTYPFLAQYGGAVKAAARVTEAMRLAVTKVTDPDLAKALKQAEDDGTIKPQEIFQLQAEASRSLGSNLYARTALAAWGSMFQAAEVFNRRTAFIAAYQTAKADGMKNPMAFAEDAVNQTQGIFNKGNRPNWGRGAVGATIFTFKTFTIQYVEFLVRLSKAGPEGKKAAALALGMLVVLAGVRGLPFAGDAEDLIDAAAQALGYNFTTRAAMNDWAVKMLGEDLADVAQHGFSGFAGMPFDVSQRLGMHDLLPGTGILKKSETRKEDQVLEAFGVAGSFVRDALRGEVRPIAIRNLDKAIDIANTGMYRDTRGRKVIDADGFDAFMKALGLQPGNVGRESRAISSQYELQTLFKVVKGEISEQMALGRFEGDADKVTAAKEALDRWNEQNPEARIQIKNTAILRRVLEMRRDRRDRFLRASPREIRPTLAESL